MKPLGYPASIALARYGYAHGVSGLVENKSRPYAIDPIYSTLSPNEPIALYDGTMDVKIHDQVSSGTGKLQLLWQPKASMHLECTHTPPMTDQPWIKIRLPGQPDFFDVGLYSMGIGVDSTGLYGTAKGSSREMHWVSADETIRVSITIA